MASIARSYGFKSSTVLEPEQDGVRRVFIPLDPHHRSLCGCQPEKRAMFMVRAGRRIYKLCAQCAAAFHTEGRV